MQSRYNSTCRKCGKPIEIGDEIYIINGVWQHYTDLIPLTKWRGPKPRIEIVDKGGWHAFTIYWKDHRIEFGDATRHSDCLAIAQRVRKRIMIELLNGDERWTRVIGANAYP